MRDSPVDLIGIRRKGNGQPGVLVKFHEEEFVLRIRGLEKCRGGLRRLAYLVVHAATGVEDQAD